eukprot:jgi/Chrzof1/13468/UNPLg00553.t1
MGLQLGDHDSNLITQSFIQVYLLGLLRDQDHPPSHPSLNHSFPQVHLLGLLCYQDYHTSIHSLIPSVQSSSPAGGVVRPRQTHSCSWVHRLLLQLHPRPPPQKHDGLQHQSLTTGA